MSHQESPVSDEQLEHITRNWGTAEDTCHDYAVDYVPDFEWPCVPDKCGEFKLQKRRELPEELKSRATAYILTILKRYPFQLWPELSLPMFHRFLDVWNDTGDRRKAMRVI